MSLVHSFNLGALRCHALEAGRQRLDGGAMFGVVPKPLWEERIAPDGRNRTLESKRRILEEPEEKGWWFFFEHDAETIMGRLGQGDRRPVLGSVVRSAWQPEEAPR